jgi:iron complex outermembrane receptor protein
MRDKQSRAAALFAAAVLSLAAPAQARTRIETIEITATRIPEPVASVPADLSLISDDELHARGATDLRGALSLVPGVEAPPGGDAGPSSAVLSLWGLHEFDAFLLVVDSVPWGGAFNPAISSLNLNDVKSIEVLKGGAPVMYGATSFVGVVHVLHRTPAETEDEAEVSIGDFGSARGAATIVLPTQGDYRHALAVDAESLGFADAREAVRNAHALYRGTGSLGAGTFRIDADLSFTRDVPPSPVVRDGIALTAITPRDANFNPADSAVDENRYHLSLGYSQETDLGLWDTIVSFAHSDIRDIRGFLQPDLIDNGSENADSQNQRRFINDAYFDTHVANRWGEAFDLVAGADLLYGLGKQISVNGAYYVPLTGATLAPASSSLHIDEINTISDQRFFAGQYIQADWKPDARWDFTAGLRLNETFEAKDSAHIDGFDPADDESARENHQAVRLSGTVGVSFRAWSDGNDEMVFYADYRNVFKPSAIDFGPDYTPDILDPETAQSYEGGVKGSLFDGRLHFQTELFLLNFQNLVVATTNALGDPVLVNAGGERLQGAEVDVRYALTEDLELAGTFAFHDARFTHFMLDDGGTPIDVSGNQLTLAPRILASGGLLYTPPQGLRATIVLNYAGRRYLDEENAAPAPGYEILAATIGYRFGRYELSLRGFNLTDRRPPVSQSEFGASSYYLLPARSVFVNLAASL